MFKEWFREDGMTIVAFIFVSAIFGAFIMGIWQVDKNQTKTVQEIQNNCKLALNKVHTASDTIAIYTANHDCIK